MEIEYQIRYLEEVVHKHIQQLSSNSRALIKRAIEERLMIDPVSFGKPLRYILKGHRRLSVENYCIIYCIAPENRTVVIVTP